MDIGFFTPYFRTHRGNSVTSMRLKYGMETRGCRLHPFAYDEEAWNRKQQERMTSVSFYHILHASRFARWQKQTGFSLDKPFIITMGGTDVNEDLFDPSQREEVLKLFKQAAWITVFTSHAENLLLDADPGLKGKIHVIPQSVWIPARIREHKSGTDRQTVNIPDERPLIFLPAGLRKVKDVLYVWEALVDLKRRVSSLQFLIAGPVLEEEVHQEVRRLEDRFPWFHYAGDVAFTRIPELYKRADLIINTSRSEGQSLALLEAMSFARPVLARRNGSNESFIEDGKTGFLFSDRQEFFDKAWRLLSDPRLMRAVGRAGEQKIQREHRLENETDAYLRLYEQLA